MPSIIKLSKFWKTNQKPSGNEKSLLMTKYRASARGRGQILHNPVLPVDNLFPFLGPVNMLIPKKRLAKEEFPSTKVKVLP